MKCITENGQVNIIALTPLEAQQIKRAIRICSIRHTWVDGSERLFADRLVLELSEAQSHCITPNK